MMDGRQDRDRFLVQAGIKFNFSEFISIFNLVFGFYFSGQKSRQNMDIKSYRHLIFFITDGSIGTVLLRKQQSNSTIES
jgi:hypothetical protein